MTVTGVERLTPVVLGDCRASPDDQFDAAIARAIARNIQRR